MSGWRRLWITLSILFGVPATVAGYEAEKYLSTYVDLYDGQTNDGFWKMVKANPALSSCDWREANATKSFGKTYRIQCRNLDAPVYALMWGLLPAFLMALIGLTSRWIYRGFKTAKK